MSGWLQSVSRHACQHAIVSVAPRRSPWKGPASRVTAFSTEPRACWLIRSASRATTIPTRGLTPWGPSADKRCILTGARSLFPSPTFLDRRRQPLMWLHCEPRHYRGRASTPSAPMRSLRRCYRPSRRHVASNCPRCRWSRYRWTRHPEGLKETSQTTFYRPSPGTRAASI